MRVHLTLALPALLLASTMTTACNGDGHGDGDTIRLDEASDEVVLTLRDLIDRGQGIEDDDIAAQLTAPADGAQVAAASPATLSWSRRQTNLRHGRTTGEFVWLEIDCAGMERPIDVVAIESTSWQPDAERWGHMTGGGSCQVQVVSAYVDRGVVEEGPYLPSSNPRFTFVEE
jgi:hypothetical protein